LKFHDCGDWWPISFLSSSKKQPRDQKFSARRDEDGHPDKWPAVFPKNFIRLCEAFALLFAAFRFGFDVAQSVEQGAVSLAVHEQRLAIR
jgi:hypothetical protein